MCSVTSISHHAMNLRSMRSSVSEECQGRLDGGALSSSEISRPQLCQIYVNHDVLSRAALHDAACCDPHPLSHSPMCEEVKMQIALKMLLS